jgi:hypothetical protein
MTRNPYTRSLFPRRRNDDDGGWLYYECSKCGKMIDAPPDDPETLEKLFIRHVKSEHPTERKPREDVNRAAARVVQEATERD